MALLLLRCYFKREEGTIYECTRLAEPAPAWLVQSLYAINRTFTGPLWRSTKTPRPSPVGVYEYEFA